MTKTACRHHGLRIPSEGMGATRLRRIASAALCVPVLLIAACSSGPRTPAPIVDRSNKAPPVVIVSSVGQAKAPTPATPQASPQASPQVTPQAGPQSTPQAARPPSTARSQAPQPPSTVRSPATSVPSTVDSSPNASASGSATQVLKPDGDVQAPPVTTRPIRNPQIASNARNEAPSAPERNSRTEQPANPEPAAKPAHKADPVKPAVPSNSALQGSAADSAGQDAATIEKPPIAADIEWIWPAEGKSFSTFSAGKGGLRIEGNSGDPILAIGDGKVIFAGQGPKGYGNLLIVRHEGELLSVYAHNRALLVQEGSQVKKGQKIAEMGDSGADRTQLGFELRRNGRPIDPRSALPQR